MIRRGRARGRSESDLASRAQAAPRRVLEAAPAARGGLAGEVVRALGLSRPASGAAEPEPAEEAADTAELRRLREALTQELDRVARERRALREDAAAEGADAPPGVGGSH
jgi:hypothetical protein